jgi:hypothetical protein
MNKKKNESQNKKVATGFNAIYIDSDNEDDVEPVRSSNASNGKQVTIKDEFPALCPAKPIQPLVTGWASIVTKSATTTTTTNIQSKLPVVDVATDAKPLDTKKRVIPMKRDFHVRKSWADWSDSDTGDEDEDDEEEDKGEFPSFLESPPNFYSDYC